MARKILPVVLAFLAVSYFGYRAWANHKDAEADQRYYGTVEATETVVGVQVTGRIVKLHVAEGQKVEAGQLLAELDDGIYRDQLKQAEAARDTAAGQVNVIDANLAALDINLRRVRTLADRDYIPRSQREDLEAQRKVVMAQKRQAEAAAAQAEAAVEVVKRQVGYARIEAPVAGTVLRIHGEAGETMFPGSALLTIADMTRMEVRVFLPETMLGRVRLNQEVELFTDGDPSRPFPARVSYISDTAEFTPKNVQTREERVRLVYAVKVEADNGDGVLKIGMPVDAKFAEE